MMLFLALPLCICFLGGLISKEVSAWQVDPSCSVNTAASLLAGALWEPTIQLQMGSTLAAHVTAATIEAQNIALYMAQKALQGPRGLDNLMQDLLGTTTADDPETLAWIGTSVTNIMAAMNVASTNEGAGAGLIITCSDAHLTPIDASKGLYRDNKRGGAQVRVPRSADATGNNACGRKLQGFAYGYNGGQVIVLCSDNEAGAANKYITPTLQNFRDGGDLRPNPRVIEIGVDALAGALSVKILHELFHVGGFYTQAQNGFGIDNPFPAQLPERVNNQPITEIYTWNLISGKSVGSPAPEMPALSHNNALHNADSMAILEAGWYLYRYAWVDGACKTVGAPRRSPSQYEGQGLPIDPDGYGGFQT